jgi:hypothetical protein
MLCLCARAAGLAQLRVCGHKHGSDRVHVADARVQVERVRGGAAGVHGARVDV